MNAIKTLARAAFSLALVFNSTISYAQAAKADLLALSLEDLMTIEVTSVTKKSQQLSHSAAAIYVISNEDLRRSGVRSIAEALRMVPGVQVARLDANKWSISSRGFSGRFANKLLVLVDGRSIYTPLFSGVFWETQDTVLEDIERIEVIRGPGATLWGANAVNGVINIITKRAEDTQGTVVSIGTGTEERGFASARFGAKLSDATSFRAYTKYLSRDSAFINSGAEATDDWDMARAGFRLDTRQASNNYTVQGDVYQGRTGETVFIPTTTAPYSKAVVQDNTMSGANLLARWQHLYSTTSDLSLQFYYDTNKRENPSLVGIDERNIADLDFQHSLSFAQSHAVVWGAGYRRITDSISGTSAVQFTPEERADSLLSAFVQDEFSLFSDNVRATIGSKFEHNDLTGSEIQPNARLVWLISERQSLWSAISRAIRTPSRADDSVKFNSRTIAPRTPGQNPSAWPALIQVVGNSDLQAEELLAYELGYRIHVSDRASWDIATFYNDYDKLRALETGSRYCSMTGNPPPCAATDYLIVPRTMSGKMHGYAYGVEVVMDWQPHNNWLLHSAYSFLDMRLDTSGTSTDTTAQEAETKSPTHQLSIRASTDITHNVEFDAWLRYVDALDSLNVPRYTTLDLRLGWQATKHMELVLGLQNLLDSHHPEFASELINTQATEVERSAYGKVAWRW